MSTVIGISLWFVLMVIQLAARQLATTHVFYIPLSLFVATAIVLHTSKKKGIRDAMLLLSIQASVMHVMSGINKGHYLGHTVKQRRLGYVELLDVDIFAL